MTVRPVVLFSRCLAGEACRYDGGRVDAPVAERLRARVDARLLCPEVTLGLGTPRAPIRLVAGRLLQPGTGRELTEPMRALGEAWAARADELDGAVLKSRSPSCGLVDAKQYARVDAEEPVGAGAGLFAATLVAGAPDLPVIDEARLELDAGARAVFLERVWRRARAR